MRTILLLSGAAALAMAGPALAQDHGKGHGGGHGQAAQHGGGHGQAAQHGGGNARGQSGHGAKHHGPQMAQQNHGPPAAHQQQQRAAEHGRSPQQRGNSQNHAQVAPGRSNGHPMPQQRNAPQSAQAHGNQWNRQPVLNDRNQPVRKLERRTREVTSNVDVWHFERPRQRFVDGCPPGLAKKYNGCLPPGQAKQMIAQRPYYDGWWSYPQQANYQYRYDNGYLYRINPTTAAVSAFIPLLGGALSVGNVWPSDYQAVQVPAYYPQYYGYDNPYDYRYANNVLYGVNPQNNTIEQIAALMTGDQWTVGQAMPPGYGVYNVPYQYRSQYYDSPQAMYRYSDGYIYRMDPTTQLVQAAIQLLS